VRGRNLEAWAASVAAVTKMAALPTSVRIREVGPRDGFQNEPDWIPTADKVRLVNALARTGLRRLEVTSFVRSDRVPQLADASQVLDAIDVPAGVDVSVLVPNERGLEDALRHRTRFHEVGVFVSASETHNRRNVNRPVADSLAAAERMVATARAEGLRAEAVVATAFGCPYEGVVEPARVLDLAARLREAGAAELGFGDTTGMANPRQVSDLLARAREEIPGVELTAHFHNTRGQGLANVLAALEAGIDSFESSFGELGGCPVPKGSTGNIATEDLVSMCHEMGIETGISLERLLEAARDVQGVLGRPLGSHLITAGPIRWHDSP
jgi:hydroxymethylglutaryl-CoA lyase